MEPPAGVNGFCEIGAGGPVSRPYEELRGVSGFCGATSSVISYERGPKPAPLGKVAFAVRRKTEEVTPAARAFRVLWDRSMINPVGLGGV